MIRVLIAEDDPSLRVILALVFDTEHFQLRFAVDGQDAINCLDEYLPDVIFLDVNMPKRSGLDVLHYIRQHFPGHQMRIILITGNSSVVRLPEAQFADLVLMKPFQVQELLTFIARLVTAAR